MQEKAAPRILFVVPLECLPPLAAITPERSDGARLAWAFEVLDDTVRDMGAPYLAGHFPASGVFSSLDLPDSAVAFGVVGSQDPLEEIFPLFGSRYAFSPKLRHAEDCRKEFLCGKLLRMEPMFNDLTTKLS